jgi:serine/threonine protein kinase
MHRDIKLDNILINKKEIIKFIDFGFAKEYDEDNYGKTFCGTPIMMSPEVLSSYQNE